MRVPERLPTVLVLGSTQTLAWASSYYLPAILADPIARDLGVSTAWVFGAFSASLLVAAVLGPRIGRTIDALGGRGVLSASNVVLAAGLGLLGLASSVWMMGAAWLLLGLGMGLGLYDAAFAALGRIYGLAARPSITGITLLAGFASTIGWPLSAWGVAQHGWRETCFAWALANLLVGLPLNLLLLPKSPIRPEEHQGPKAHVAMDRNMWLLAAAFALAWTVTGAMAAHLPRLLEAGGATAAQAIAAGALIGPAQVAARIFEALVLGRAHPLLSARLATLTHPLGAGVVGLLGGAGVPALAFAALHGFGNGILTIARGTVPLAIYGPASYGHRLGLLGAPARIAQALAPLAFGVLVDWWGFAALIVSSLLSLSALAALLLVRKA
ncbi:MAG TPA: MFS transporter [Xanthobacteraceae bacterium]|jgi:predicted MFS family arabinose efflux permease